MTESQASYSIIPNTIMIELADMDLSGYTIQNQAAKVAEEWGEFLAAQTKKPALDHVAEEAFDLMQALAGYLDMLGVDIEAANGKHLAKVWERGNKPRGRER